MHNYCELPFALFSLTAKFEEMVAREKKMLGLAAELGKSALPFNFRFAQRWESHAFDLGLFVAGLEGESAELEALREEAAQVKTWHQKKTLFLFSQFIRPRCY